MKRRSMKSTVLVVFTLFIFFVIISPASAVRFMNIATSRVGGSYYPLGEAFSTVVNKYVPDVKMNATTSEGPYENIRRLQKKSADLAFLLHNAAYDAYMGEGVFKGKEYKDLRIIFNMPNAPLQCLTMTKSGIKDVNDFRGKRVGTGTGGSSIPNGLETILKVYGMSNKDVKLVPLSRRDRAKALPDGNIDVGYFLIGEGSALMTELTTVHDVTFISLPMDKLKEIEKIKPYWVPWHIKKEVYPKALKTDYQGPALPASTCVDASLPTDLVYNIVKAIWDHYKELTEMNKYWRRMKQGNAMAVTSGIPIHPGAERYFKEIGLLK